jgi:hypothetical protein
LTFYTRAAPTVDGKFLKKTASREAVGAKNISKAGFSNHSRSFRLAV